MNVRRELVASVELGRASCKQQPASSLIPVLADSTSDFPAFTWTWRRDTERYSFLDDFIMVFSFFRLLPVDPIVELVILLLSS